MLRTTRGRALRLLCFIAAIMAIAVIAGCGSDSAEESDSGSESGTNSSVAQEAKEQQAALFEGEGYKSPPTTSPPPAEDKSIWIVSCGQAITSCSTPIDAAVEAAEAMGWDVTLYDAKLDPARTAEGYRQAIAAGADGIFLYSLDCPLAQGPLKAAKEAGIPVVAGEVVECDTPLFDYVVDYTQGSFEDWWREVGAGAATNLIAGTDGAPKTIVLHQTDVPLLVPTLEGFQGRYEECGGSCEIVETVEFTTADLGAPLQQKIQQAILETPDANSMYLEYDMYSLGVDGALRASGRQDQILVSIAEGQASTMAELRAGRLKGVGMGIPQSWEAYHGIDALNRIFAGEEPAESGMGIQAFSEDQNIPAEGRWAPPIDFKPVYLKAWGVDP